MKLRTRLFLSGSALLTVALLGLLLGMFSVLQLTQQQSQAMTRNLQIIDSSLGMRQELGKQVTLLLAEELDRDALENADRLFRQWLRRAEVSARAVGDAQALSEVGSAYARFGALLQRPQAVRRELLKSDAFGEAEAALRESIHRLQNRYVSAVDATEERTRQRAWMIAGLLGLIGLAMLLIGFVTAHSLAQRFGRPIEALARAADQIGRGDFQLTLPLSPLPEMAALSRRFGLMAEALHQFQATNVEALVAEQRRLQAVLDSIDDGLLILYRQGRLEHGNPVAQRQLGWDDVPRGQSLGQALQRAELDEQLQLVLAGISPERAPQDLAIEAGGEARLLAYSLTPVSQEQGPLLGAVMVLHDVTEQRAFERVRREFVLRASHELRTPVTGMHMAFALLQERLEFAAGSREADLLATVDEEMQRLLLLINDLLNFSRYQNGLQQLELTPCDPAELLQQARQRFAARAEERDVALRLELQEPLPRLRADRLQLERVLDNLLGNALRHSHPGGEIRLQARRQGERLVFGVEDQGEGIAYGQQARIFEPFVQVGRRKGGAGLGLALCKEIVQLHGGQIAVQSQPGHGSRFYMALPL